MRKTMKKFMALAAMAMAALSCGKKEIPQQDPVFPDPVEKYIEVGESVEIEFTANLDWVLSISGADAAYFYMIDGGMQVPQISGKAGVQKVTVYEKSTGSTSRTCSLSLTMAQQTRDIVTIHTETSDPQLTVFAGKVNEDGGFTIVGGGEYEYESEAAENLHVIWPGDAPSYMLPIKVVSNFGWSISSTPEWLDPSKAQSDGEDTFLVLRGKADKLPLDDASGKISFMNPRTKKVLFEYSVSIDGCKEKVRYSRPSDHVYLNVLGQYYSGKILVKDGCPLVMSATSGSDVVAFELRDGVLSYVDAYNSWLNIARSEAPGSNVIRDITFNVTASRNNGDERSILLLGIPASVLASINPSTDILQPDGSAVKEEYQGYVMTTVSQRAVDPSAGYSAICPLNTPYQMAVFGADILRTDAGDPSYAALASKYSTNEIYTANLNNWGSADNLLLNISESYNSVAFCVDGNEKDTDDCIAVDYPRDDDRSTFTFVINNFIQGGETAVVFKSNGAAVAIVICRMSDAYWPYVEFNDIHFVGEDSSMGIMPEGATLSEITEGELYEKYKGYKGLHVWKLSYEKVESIRNAMFYVPPFPAMVSGSISIDEQDKPWLGAEPSISESDRLYMTVRMDEKAPERGNTGVIVLYGGGRPLFVLQCERQFLK